MAFTSVKDIRPTATGAPKDVRMERAPATPSAAPSTTPPIVKRGPTQQQIGTNLAKPEGSQYSLFVLVGYISSSPHFGLNTFNDAEEFMKETLPRQGDPEVYQTMWMLAKQCESAHPWKSLIDFATERRCIPGKPEKRVPTGYAGGIPLHLAPYWENAKAQIQSKTDLYAAQRLCREFRWNYRKLYFVEDSAMAQKTESQLCEQFCRDIDSFVQPANGSELAPNDMH